MTTPACPHRRCRRCHPQGPEPPPPPSTRSGRRTDHHSSAAGTPDTALTDLIKMAIASRARTSRLVVLLAATTALLLVLLAVIVSTTMLIGPTAGAVAGGVPLATAALGTATRYLRHGRTSRDQDH
jgi:hypothetical protein